MHGLFYNQREMPVMILQNSVLGTVPKLGSSGDADYVDVLMAHISTRKCQYTSCVRTGMSVNIVYCSAD